MDNGLYVTFFLAISALFCIIVNIFCGRDEEKRLVWKWVFPVLTVVSVLLYSHMDQQFVPFAVYGALVIASLGSIVLLFSLRTLRVRQQCHSVKVR